MQVKIDGLPVNIEKEVVKSLDQFVDFPIEFVNTINPARYTEKQPVAHLGFRFTFYYAPCERLIESK